MRSHKVKPFAVSGRAVSIFAHVVAKCLLVQIAKEMERLDANVCAAQSALEQAPKVFKIVGVHLAVHVGDGMIYHLVHVIPNETFIGWQGVSEESRASRDLLAYFQLQWLLFAAVDYGNANVSAAFENAENGSLALVPHVHL